MRKKIIVVLFALLLFILLGITFGIVIFNTIEPDLHRSFCNDLYEFFPKNSQDKRFSLEMKDEYGNGGMILDYCNRYQIKENQVFVISEKEGYAVIDLQTKECKVYVSLPKAEISALGWVISNPGEKEIYRSKIEHDYVFYLNSYEEFSRKEQDIFEQMPI